ncbi:MAG: hypothetical protein IPN17_28110 [Deltaproteobacteria bacterium]|nr:hypothetical protein [Deltaproteobacteria bacterium]
MMQRLSGLMFAVSLAASPLAVAQDRVPAPPAAPPVALQQPAPGPTPPLCCCRVWSHGWQYSWRDTGACTAANGTCVSPDHC